MAAHYRDHFRATRHPIWYGIGRIPVRVNVLERGNLVGEIDSLVPMGKVMCYVSVCRRCGMVSASPDEADPSSSLRHLYGVDLDSMAPMNLPYCTLFSRQGLQGRTYDEVVLAIHSLPGGRGAELCQGDAEELENAGARVWVWNRITLEETTAGGGWADIVAGDGFSPGHATETWYDDGSLLVSVDTSDPNVYISQ